MMRIILAHCVRVNKSKYSYQETFLRAKDLSSFPDDLLLHVLMEIGQPRAHFSVPSVIAILAAAGSFFVGAFGGFVLALVAIVFGIIGLALSLAPSVRGGFISLFSVIVASIGMVIAAIKAITWLF
jgi:hypothetical protein